MVQALGLHTLALLRMLTWHVSGGREVDVYKTLKKMYDGGPNKSIEAVGFHYAKSMMHRFEMATGLETDPSDVVNEMITSTRKVRAALGRNSLL